MDGLLLTVGFILQALSVIWIIFYIRDRRAKKRFKEESLGVVELDERVVERVMSVLETEELYGITGTTNEWEAFDNRDYTLNLTVDPTRYNFPIPSTQKDFLPKKKMKHHTLEEPIFFGHSENEAESDFEVLDEGCGCDTACNCYDTTFYDTTIYDL